LCQRCYGSYLNQFVQPDTIIPEPANAANWNRYAYTNYNPINYNDPSGHAAHAGGGAASAGEEVWEKIKIKRAFEEKLRNGISLVPEPGAFTYYPNTDSDLDYYSYVGRFVDPVTIGPSADTIFDDVVRPARPPLWKDPIGDVLEYGPLVLDIAEEVADLKMPGAVGPMLDAVKQIHMDQDRYDLDGNIRLNRVLTRAGQGVVVSFGAGIFGTSAGLAAQGAFPEAPGLAFGVGYTIGFVSSYSVLANWTEPAVQQLFLNWER
jgi:hypothetical protein